MTRPSDAELLLAYLASELPAEPAIALEARLKEEPLLAAFNMERGSAVAEAKAVLLVDNVQDSTAVQGPETKVVGFDSDDCFLLDFGLGIGHPDPAEIEVPPEAKGIACGFEGQWAVADFGADVVADVALGNPQRFRSALRVQRDTVAAGQITRPLQLPVNRGRCWLGEREHPAQYATVTVSPLVSSGTTAVTR